MNKIKKYNSVRSFASLFVTLCLGVVLVCTGCSRSDEIAGTSEEPNEIAREESSSSLDSTAEESSSSSAEEKVVSSSSSEEKVVSSSSSDGKIAQSSSSEPKELSSSSSAPAVSSSSSSSKGNGQSGDRPGGDPPPSAVPDQNLAAYAYIYGNSKATFDDAVLATKVVYREKDFDPIGTDPGVPGSQPGDAVTELNSPGLHKIGNRLDVLYDLYPESAEKLIAVSERAAEENEKCETYLYNVSGLSDAIGHVLTQVTADTIAVADIRAGECKNSTEGMVLGFVFVYCGEMNEFPREKREYVDRGSNTNTCPVSEYENEWAK